MGCQSTNNAEASLFYSSIGNGKRQGGKRRIPLFELGHITISQGVEKCIPAERITAALSRHQCGDWGDTPELNRDINNDCLTHGMALVSEFDTKVQEEETTFWIITNATREETTVLLQEEY